MDDKTVLHILQSNGRPEECIEFSSIKGNYDRTIRHYINKFDFKNAIKVITDFEGSSDKNKKRSQLMIKYIGVLLQNEPDETLKLL